MRNEYNQAARIYGDIVCYETLTCDSGLLCLDWQEICHEIQQCFESRDEENCELLEMNGYGLEDEFRCTSGMCIPDQFFLDGERDCLVWSDELPLANKTDCPIESISTECDDHLCAELSAWSWTDGEGVLN